MPRADRSSALSVRLMCPFFVSPARAHGSSQGCASRYAVGLEIEYGEHLRYSLNIRATVG